MNFAQNYILSSLLLSFLVQIVFFVFAAINKTDKLTDLSYGMTFIILAFYTYFQFGSGYPYQILILLMIISWGLRLSGYLFFRILKTKKDKRFDGVRENPLKFARFWFFQALAVWVISLPSNFALSQSKFISPSIWLSLGFFIWLSGLFIETLADIQKYIFKSNPKNHGMWIHSGIWKFSRHPNYFGEIICWWGIFLTTIPLQEGYTWMTVVGPIFITFILLFVSGIPPLEKKYDQIYKNNSEYQKYKKQTSLLVPLPTASNS